MVSWECPTNPREASGLDPEAVHDEAVTLTQMRTGDVEAGLELGRRIRGDGYPSAIELLYSSQRLFDRAVTVQQTYADHGLSFTDAFSVAMVESNDIDCLLSFDDDFDGVVDRLAPETLVSE